MTQPLPKILPVNELKNTASIMKTCQESSVPIVITKNGTFLTSFHNTCCVFKFIYR